MIYCRQVIHSWTKTEKLSQLVSGSYTFWLNTYRLSIIPGIKRTKLRLVRCRARMAMNHRDRVNDARADQNLADVARIPAPWDAKPSKPSSPLHTNISLPWLFSFLDNYFLFFLRVSLTNIPPLFYRVVRLDCIHSAARLLMIRPTTFIYIMT